MATINLSPLTAEQESLDRRRKMAEAMQQQAILPIEMPTVPGAKVSPYQGFAKLLQGYIAGKNLEKAEQEKKQYEADTLSDMAKIYRNINEYETIPGTPAVPEQTTTTVEPNIANQNLQAVAARQMTRDPNAPVSPFERPIGMDERAQISQLPLESTQQTVTPAVAAVPERKVPLLSFDSINDPNLMKSSAGRMMLAQALIQRQAQEQAKAEKAAEKAQEFRVVAPGGTVLQGNKPVFTAPKDSPPREIKTNDPLTGMPITKYVPENVLVTLGNIPDQYKGFAADLITANNLPAQITNNPQLLNLIGSQLNKAAGQVTPQDVSNYMLKVAETRAKLGYEGIPFAEPKPMVAASNPLVKPALPKGVPLGAVATGKFTPDGRPVYQTPDGKNHVEDK
jgi:hypothetical protein